MIRTFRSRAVATVALVSMVVTPTTAFANDAPTACPDGQVASSGFADTEGTVHEQNIDCILHYGITQGLNARTYGPSLNVSRAQMATFLARTIDLAAALPAATDQGFQDIRGTVHEDRINQLAAVGVANGTSVNSFSPNLSISRGQMAVFLVRAWEASTDQVLQRQGTRRFNDTEGTAFADAIDVAFEMGWTKGTSSGNYSPGAPVSRGAMASFIARFLEDLSARGSIGKGTAPSLTAFTVGDNDGSGSITNGDTLTLKFDQDMIAQSSITLQAENGCQTTIDDDSSIVIGVPDGTTKSSPIQGSGTDTLVFTLAEDIDFVADSCTGDDQVLTGTITITAAEGISSVEGQAWIPSVDDDGDTTVTLTPAPPAGGGGGGGGGTPATAPSTVSLAFTPDQISASEATSVVIGGNSNGTSPVTVTIVVEDFEGDKITTTAVASGAGDYSSVIDFSATPNAAISDGTITATATATNTVGSATPVTATALLDREAPATPTATVVDDPITQVNQDAVRVTGTAEAGSTVFVDFEDSAAGGTSVSTTASSIDGTYTTTADLTGLADGDITVTAYAQDAAGNEGPDSAPFVAEKDTSGPAVLTVSIEDGNELLNEADRAAGINVMGTVSSTATSVLVSLEDSAGTTVTATAGMSWTACIGFCIGSTSFSADFEATDTATFVDGPITATAVATDDDGNAGTPLSDSSELDATAPDAPSDVTFDPDPIPLAEQNMVAITGSAEDGALVTVTIDDTNATTAEVVVTATATATGFTIDPVDVSDLDEGDLDWTATAQDPAGNVSDPASTGTVEKDITPPTDPTITFDAGFESINAAEESAVTLSGDNVAAGDILTVIVVDKFDNTVEGVVTATSTIWSITLDLSGGDGDDLIDGPLTATAQSADAAGNQSNVSAPANAVLDADPGTITINIDDGVDAFINDAENTAGVVIQGDAEANSDIAITITSGALDQLATATANGAGSWSTTLTLTLPDGPITATAKSVDPADNSVETTSPATSTLDTFTEAPTVVFVDGDGFINASEQLAGNNQITGTAEAFADVTVTVTDGAIDVTTSATADDSGAFTAIFDAKDFPSDGTLTATATSVDIPGNESDESAADTTELDTTGPTVTNITFDPDPVGQADASSVDVFGDVSEASQTITVTIDDTNATTASVTQDATNLDGTVSWTADAMDVSTLVNGEITARVVATDLAGNAGSIAEASTTLDRSAPAAAITAFTSPLNIDSGTLLDVTGTATPEDVDFVRVVVTDGTASTAPVDAPVSGGAWSATDIDVTTLAQGTLTITATPFDLAGNAPAEPPTATVAYDVEAPAAPAVFFADGDGAVNATEAGSALITGTAEADADVIVFVYNSDGFVNSGAGTATGGLFSVNVDVSGSPDGILTVTAQAVDAVGNVGDETDPGDTTTLDTISLSPTALTIDDGGDGLLNAAEDDAVTVTGSAEDGATVTVILTDPSTGNISVTGTATGGTFEIVLDASGLDDNATLTATAVADDAAGNATSVDSDTDSTFHDASTVDPTVVIEDGGDGVLNDAEDDSVTVTGTAEMGAAVQVVFTGDGLTVTETAEATDGTYTITAIDLSGFGDSTITATATATDVAGNESGEATDAVDHDTESVPTPTVVIVTDDGFINADETTDVVVTGTAEPFSSVFITITDGASAVVVNCGGPCFPEADADGNFTGFADVSSLADGTLTAIAVATDEAGNEFPESAPATAILDTMVASPTAVAIDDGDGFVNADEQSTITVTASASDANDIASVVFTLTDGTVSLTDTATADEGTYTAVFDLTGEGFSDGTITATAVATDVPGNMSETSSTDTATLDTSTTTPTAVSIDSGDDEFVNGAEDDVLTITGKAEPGAVVTVTVVDANEGSVDGTDTADELGDFAVTVNASTLADGVITATATAVDEAGNASGTSDADTATKDATLDPTSTITIQDGGDEVISSGEVGAPIVVDGAAEDGATVSVLIEGSGFSETVETTAAAGAWSVTFTASAYGDGTITATATVTDGAGNTVDVDDTSEVDTVGPTFTASQDVAGSPVITLSSDEAIDPASVDTDMTDGSDDFTVGPTLMCGATAVAATACTIGSVAVAGDGMSITVTLAPGFVQVAGTLFLDLGEILDDHGNASAADSFAVSAVAGP